MPMRTKTASRIGSPDLRRIDHDVAGKVINLCVDVRRKATGEKLFSVGGIWDRVEGRFLEEQPKRAKVIWLNEAQCLGEEGTKLEDGPAWALKQWIEGRRAGEKRVIELVFDGGRGSGKSVLAVLAVFLIAIEFPDARCWLVSPANTRKGEIVRIVRDFIPEPWRRAYSERDFTYTLPNGSTVSYIGADDEDSLKQGGYEVALLNEAQLMTARAYTYAAGGVRNVSGRPKGLLILAHNYADKVRGEWTYDHLDKIDAGGLNAKHFKMDPSLNGFLDEGTQDDTDALVRSVDPEQADRDLKGVRKRLGDIAAHAFKNHRIEFGGHIGRPPEDWVDVTRQITAKKTESSGYAIVWGADFQRRPGCVAVAFRLFRRPDGKIVYWVEVVIVAGDNEDDLAQRMDTYLCSVGLTARDALVVADASGRWQNADHTTRTKPSHAILKDYFFAVVPPARSKSGGALAGKNPVVEDSLAQFNDVLKEDRFLVSGEAEWMCESLYRCKTKKRGGGIRLDDTKGYSHPVDCGRYVVAYFEPKRGPVQPDGGFNREAFEAFGGIRITG